MSRCGSDQQVCRQAQMDRPRATRAGNTHGSGDIASNGVDIAAGPRGLGQRIREFSLAHLLKRPHACLAQGCLARQQHNGRLSHLRGIKRRQRVGMAGATGHQCDSRFSGQSGPGVGHVNGSGLVTGMDEADAGVQGRVEYRHHMVARQREDLSDTGSLQYPNQGICTSEFARSHVISKRQRGSSDLSQQPLGRGADAVLDCFEKVRKQASPGSCCTHRAARSV